MFQTVVVVDSLSAWRTPIAGFITEFLMIGFGLSFGIILIDLHHDYGVSHEHQLVTSLVSLGLAMILSPVMECVTNYIGPKVSLLISTVIMTLSLTLLFFVPITGASVLTLLGICTGIGRAFANFLLYKYIMIAFRKHRGAAAAVFKTGASIGAIVFPPILAFLLDFYGARITVLLLGAGFLNLLVASLLMPSVIIDDKTGRRLTPLPKCKCFRGALKESDRNETTPQNANNVTNKMKKEPLTVTLPFLIFVIAVICLLGLSIIACLYVYALFMAEVGLSRYTIAAALSTRSIVDLFARSVVSGFIFDRVGKRGKLFLLSFTQMIGFASIVPLLFELSDPTVAVFMHGIGLGIMNGIGAVGWMQVVSVMAGNFHLGRVMSIVMLVTGLGLIVTSLGFGALKRMLGTYKPLYMFNACSIAFSAIFLVFAAFIFNRCSLKDPKFDITLEGEEDPMQLDTVKNYPCKKDEDEAFSSSHSLT